MPGATTSNLKMILKRCILPCMRLRLSALSRPALKTLTYSAMHFAVAISVAFALTRSWQAALAIGMIEPLVQTGAYAVHERVWERLGRQKPSPENLTPLA